MIPVFHAKIVNGKTEFDTGSKIAVYLETLEGKRVDITVKEHKSQRSSNQNNYYWGKEILYDQNRSHNAGL